MPKKTLIAIYDQMYAAFGPQYWWPAEDDFEVMVGAILTQSVSWKNVETAISNLKAENLLSVNAILSVKNDKLAGLIKSTMYFNQKAIKLKNLCEHIQQNYNGNIYGLLEKDIYQMRKELLSIKGIGPETADSIILYAAQKPIFVVDAYTRRIFTRLGLLPDGAKYKEMQDFFMRNFPLDVKLFNEYHALIVRLGKDFCKKKRPICTKCPINAHCARIYDELDNRKMQKDSV